MLAIVRVLIARVLIALGCRSVLAAHLHERAAWVEDDQGLGRSTWRRRRARCPATARLRLSDSDWSIAYDAYIKYEMIPIIIEISVDSRKPDVHEAQ